MWELMELSLEWQRTAFEAQARGLKALGDSARAGEATADAMTQAQKAVEANARAWSRWLRAWSGR